MGDFNVFTVAINLENPVQNFIAEQFDRGIAPITVIPPSLLERWVCTRNRDCVIQTFAFLGLFTQLEVENAYSHLAVTPHIMTVPVILQQIRFTTQDELYITKIYNMTNTGNISVNKGKLFGDLRSLENNTATPLCVFWPPNIINQSGISGHLLILVKLEDKYVIFDPQVGSIYLNHEKVSMYFDDVYFVVLFGKYKTDIEALEQQIQTMDLGPSEKVLKRANTGGKNFRKKRHTKKRHAKKRHTKKIP